MNTRSRISTIAIVNAMAMALPLGAGVAMAGDLVVDVRDAAGTAVTDAVLYAEPVAASVPPVHPNTRAIIDQVNKEFVPRVSIVQAGTEIFFPNSDNIRHSIYSFSAAKTFTTKLYSGREAAPVMFGQTGLVILGCNIHDTMVAWVFIVDTPWFARSGADGSGTIRGLPAGEYKITATAPAPAGKQSSGTLTLRVEGTATQHQSISLAAGG